MRAIGVAGRRLLEALLVLFVLASLVFFALRLVPGDPAALILGDQASPAELASVRARLHLGDPLPSQYTRFLRGLGSLDLGDSLRRPGVPALRRVGEALGPTGALAGVADFAGMRVLRVETLDGVKFFLDNPAGSGQKNAAETWLLLRASGTEPLLRVYCESCSVASVEAVLAAGRDFVLAG